MRPFSIFSDCACHPGPESSRMRRAIACPPVTPEACRYIWAHFDATGKAISQGWV
jgi:hypothetical protein